MSRIVCAIHQPNFFPWLGYFDKLRRCDVFVFLDAVQYPRSGSGGMGSWTNRVKINCQGNPKWFGAPVKKLSSGGNINLVEFAGEPGWREKLVRTLHNNYRTAPSYAAAMELLTPLLLNPDNNLANYNVHAIMTIATQLGFSPRIALHSSLATAHASTDLLIAITKAVGASAYLAGGGAGGYQEDDKFSAAGVELVYQGYEPRPYGDPAKFAPGLSIIDFLMMEQDWTNFPGSAG